MPIDEWLREETNELGLDQQSALGLALLASAHALDGEAQPNDRGVLSPEIVADIARRIGAPLDTVVEAVSAGRNWYREQFGTYNDAGAAWDRGPSSSGHSCVCPTADWRCGTSAA